MKPAIWVMVAATLPRHPKLKRLSQLLNISLAEALGRLIFIWIYALEFRRDGLFFSAAEIEDAAQWTGAPGALVDALLRAGDIQAGFIDKVEPNLFSLHDWSDFSGKNDKADAKRSAQRNKKEDIIIEDKRRAPTEENRAAAKQCFAAVMKQIAQKGAMP